MAARSRVEHRLEVVVALHLEPARAHLAERRLCRTEDLRRGVVVAERRQSAPRRRRGSGRGSRDRPSSLASGRATDAAGVRPRPGRRAAARCRRARRGRSPRPACCRVTARSSTASSAARSGALEVAEPPARLCRRHEGDPEGVELTAVAEHGAGSLAERERALGLAARVRDGCELDQRLGLEQRLAGRGVRRGCTLGVTARPLEVAADQLDHRRAEQRVRGVERRDPRVAPTRSRHRGGGGRPRRSRASASSARSSRAAGTPARRCSWPLACLRAATTSG